ncbi:NAD(P)H-flavin reductase [Marinomonas sp. M1K-6]|uniref:NAD(P)H-flavin reductase n=1 Tax=Marinomonas profundi TaxID=2726122 RepID=A0A847R129_9GAMM|nr:NAD(P)H-flavin reductase [Marinomonas profundi]NLQ17381.1 NAD(P)H-flavin reductase [Marinomonas profundi]UDV01907.1 NAD(P)H-flavin reductase [Marinomonas profundi]
MKEMTAKVNAVELINQNVYQITLQADDLAFTAGQYLMVMLPTGEQVPYSIGSAAHELPSLTLYILVSDPDSLASKVVEHIQANSSITIKAPGGDCHLNNGVLDSNPEHILLIAGGTGFAQIKSLYSALVEQNYSGKVSFYWGLRTAEDVFAQDWLEESHKYTPFTLDVVVNEKSDQWHGRSGWLYEAVLADHPDLSQSVAFISGSVGMVYGTLDQLELKGLSKERCFSDVFAYAPHPDKPVL